MKEASRSFIAEREGAQRALAAKDSELNMTASRSMQLVGHSDEVIERLQSRNEELSMSFARSEVRLEK
jgi:hypothetical protein